MRKKRRFNTFLLQYALPIITLSIFFLVRIYFLDGRVNLQAFSLLTLFIVIHSTIGGLISGLVALVYSTILATYLYIEPIGSLGLNSNTNFSRILAFVFGSLLIALFVSAFSNNRRQLKKTSEDLKKTTKRLRRVMDSIFTMVVILDRNGKIREANWSYADSLNLETNELVNKSIFDLDPWNNNYDLQQSLRLALASVNADNPVKFEHKLIIGRTVFYAEIAINFVKEGKYEEIVLAVRDRTDRKKYEDELIKSQEILSRLIDSNVVGMALADLQGEFIETNDEFLEMLGYSPEEFVENGLSWLEITPKEYKEIDQQKVDELKEKGYMTVFEKEYYHKDGHKVSVFLSGVMINDEHVLCLMLDLTPQKTLQQKKDEFISIASHELKTPMTVIKGYLQLLTKKLSQSKEDYGDFISIINFQLDKLNTLVNELHDMSKIESQKLRIHMEELDLNQLVESSIKEVSPFIDSHNIRLVEEVENLKIHGDAIRLEQVLINLLTNAIKYSPDGGDIIVTVSKEKENAVVSVKDSGMGIPKSKLKDIFTKFFQVEENTELREGLGLGLYISFEIIKQHRGTISVESKIEVGSTFTIKLPLDNYETFTIL